MANVDFTSKSLSTSEAKRVAGKCVRIINLLGTILLGDVQTTLTSEEAKLIKPLRDILMFIVTDHASESHAHSANGFAKKLGELLDGIELGR